MKNKILTIMVVMLMTVLTACGSDVDSAINEADKFMADGDFEAAKEVLLNSESYTKINNKLAEIDSEKGKDIVGTWLTLNGSGSYTFDENGTVEDKFFFDDSVEKYHYEIKDQTITIGENIYDMKFEGNILYLGESDDPICLVREEDYDDTVEVIPITLDNWDQYFEFVSSIVYPKYDMNGNIEDMMLTSGMVLKQEYVDQFVASDLMFECDFFRCNYPDKWWEPGTMNYSLGEGETLQESSWDLKLVSYDDHRGVEEFKGTDLEDKIIYAGPAAPINSEYSDPVELKELVNVQGELRILK